MAYARGDGRTVEIAQAGSLKRVTRGLAAGGSGRGQGGSGGQRGGGGGQGGSGTGKA